MFLSTDPLYTFRNLWRAQKLAISRRINATLNSMSTSQQFMFEFKVSFPTKCSLIFPNFFRLRFILHMNCPRVIWFSEKSKKMMWSRRHIICWRPFQVKIFVIYLSTRESAYFMMSQVEICLFVSFNSVISYQNIF